MCIYSLKKNLDSIMNEIILILHSSLQLIANVLPIEMQNHAPNLTLYNVPLQNENIYSER
jgi:hypothetical protein